MSEMLPIERLLSENKNRDCRLSEIVSSVMILAKAKLTLR